MAESDFRKPQEMSKEEEQRLKYLEFVQVAAVHAALCFLNVYAYAKERSGPLKPGVETVEGTVKTVVGPVYDKFHDVPIEVLKFVDRKIDESMIKIDSRVPPVVKQVSAQAMSVAQQAPVAAQAMAHEVKRAGVVDTASGIAKSVYTKCEPTAKDLYSKYEPKVEKCAVSTWPKLNQLPLFPHMAQVVVPTASYCTEKYNEAVRSTAEKGYKTILSPLLTFLFSLSRSASYSTCSHPLLSRQSFSSPPPPIPKATPSDLLSLLGPAATAACSPSSSSVNPVVADRLRSCFKFLVPFSPTTTTTTLKCLLNIWKLIGGDGIGGWRPKSEGQRDEDRLVWWPPEPVLDLARHAVNPGSNVRAIHCALDPTHIPVPDVEGSKENKCELTRTPYGRRFISEELNAYLKFLFELIKSRGSAVGLNVTLSRYDLFHGHLFLANDTGRLGILFHAKEYPSYDEEAFPYYMGYCQTGSNVIYDDSMNLRNILWLAPLPSGSTNDQVSPGVLVVLDARPDGIIYQDLIREYVQFVRTIYEDDLGAVAVDVNYLNVGGLEPDYQIFICY